MNSSQIEENLQKIEKNISPESFIFDLLLAYGIPKATVTLLKKGRHNLSKKENQIILKKKLFFQEIENEDLHVAIDNLQNDNKTMRHSPRFIIVTDYTTLLAVDTKTHEQLDIEIKKIAKYYDFFLPWAGIEKYQHKSENPADRKAAEKMAKLYDGILIENHITDAEKRHDLNIFLSRLLFCFFAEDTGIFKDGIFIESIVSHTQSDGSDLKHHLKRLFTILNTKEKERDENIPEYLKKFPYVNGGLFREEHWIPDFSPKARKIIIECGELDWKEINPDIFGSMMQAVAHPSERGSFGMHYTSVPNIMKVIEPLFLNDLKEEFEKYRGNKKKLELLWQRLSKIKFFDPACGSGNFLIISYKELRKLEMAIIEEMGQLTLSQISLNQFYGIEIDDFASQIAKLSLYLAEHQMNTAFKEKFGETQPTLPLRESGNIFCENALRVDWNKICPRNENDEVYIFGNPPYLGSRNQSKEQKEEMKNVFGEDYKSLDYISCWFFLGAKYIENSNAKLAFVSTNSICQGEQVALLWPRVLNESLEIFFAHQSFKWQNNAKGNAGVTVIIVGIRNISNEPKLILKDGISQMAKNINSYLATGDNIFVESRNKPLSSFPKMNFGNMPADGGKLIFTTKEKNEFIQMEPESAKYFKKLISADEFLNGKERWCLWLADSDLQSFEKIPMIKKRICELKKIREESSRPKLAEIPHLFAQITQPKNQDFILIPCHSSERREYIPMGFFDFKNVSHNSCLIIGNAEPFLFGILTSRMHMVWVRAVAGRLKTDYRYSSALCYNTFPIPPLTTKQKETLTRHVYTILEEREKHSEKTMAELYDPDKMLADLLQAHQSLDLAVDQIYRSRPFVSDEERLAHLFGLYERMIEDENNNLKNK